MDKLGFGYDDVKKINSKIIYCSITGFGSEGPYSKRGGFDLIRISDNGFGIHEDDLALSLDRHATSKLSNENDLVEIGTFIGYIGLFTYVVLSSLSRVPLVQKNHPLILESKHHHI